MLISDADDLTHSKLLLFQVVSCMLYDLMEEYN
jgi:hypothetical protein